MGHAVVARRARQRRARRAREKTGPDFAFEVQTQDLTPIPDAPPHVSIYPQTHYEGIEDAALSADVDFKRNVIRVDIQGERYIGDMAWTPNENGFESQTRSSSGVAMNCFIGEWLPKVWHGKCTDSRQRVFILQVGHPAHV